MMKRKHGESRQSPSENHKEQRRGGSGYFGDYKLIPRVRQYLKAHSHKNVNTFVMAEDLQRQYGEYARKKRNAFQRMVEKAYDLIQNEEGSRSDNASRLEEQHMKKRRATSPSCSESDEELIEDIEGDSVESFSPDNEEYVAYQNFNSMNNMMSTLYKNPPSASHTSTAPPPSMNSGADKSVSDTFITIDVSSDSDNDVDDTQKKENPTFFIDRGQGKAKRPSKVGSSESDRAIPSHTIPSRPQFGENLLISETNVPYSLISDNISAQARKNNSILTPGNDNRKLTITTMHHGKHGTVSEESRKRGNIISDRTENGISEKSSRSKTPKGKFSKAIKSSKDSEEETRKGPEVQISPVTFKDVGGNDKSLLEICKLLVHMRHPEVYKQLGMSPPRGFLLHGPPGCGKTLLAHAIAGELGLPFIKIAATEVVSGVSGESEEKVRDLFDKALMAAPSILFIDEIDAITPKRETASKDMERRIVAQLLSCMDDLANKTDIHVLVIGATNRPDSLDPALRRAGRFDKEISLGIPDEAARVRILQVLCRSLTLSEDFDFQYLARNTPGYVGADLGALTREAAINAVNRVFQDLQKKETTTIMETTGGSRGEKGGSENSIEIIDKDSSEQVCEKESDIIITSDETQQRPGEESEQKNIEKANISVIDNDVEMIGDEVQGGTEKNCAEVISETGPAENIHVVEDTSIQGGSKGSSTDITSELKSVLGWLKEKPPLTESQLRNLCITLRDFKEALKYVQPSAMREGFATVPDVTWEDIGALHSVREDLQLAILAPVRHAEEFSTLGLTKAQGILLAGPPGCGKTLLAKAIANESGINFISVKGPELLNMYVGESERAVRQVFQRARNSAPCVIFFDELDALCPRRSNTGEGGASVRVVNQMLTEMDGLEERKQVFIMGATNRPDIVDPAILRPGRLDKLLYVGMPTPDDRLDILQTITKRGTKPKLSEDVSLEQVAADSRCQGFTGADLAALVREASVSALKAVISNKEAIKVPLQVTKQHFNEAFSKVKPSVTKKEQERYDKLRSTRAVTGSASSSETTTGT